MIFSKSSLGFGRSCVFVNSLIASVLWISGEAELTVAVVLQRVDSVPASAELTVNRCPAARTDILGLGPAVAELIVDIVLQWVIQMSCSEGTLGQDPVSAELTVDRSPAASESSIRFMLRLAGPGCLFPRVDNVAAAVELEVDEAVSAVAEVDVDRGFVAGAAECAGVDSEDVQAAVVDD